jgi:hypothetical protein
MVQAEPAGAEEPGGQNLPLGAEQGPEQALLCSPAEEPTVPAGQRLGAAEPVGQKEPARQGLGSTAGARVAPEALKRGAVAPGQEKPAGQSSGRAVMGPAQVKPGGQGAEPPGRHRCPGLGRQAEQAVLPQAALPSAPAAKEPAGHCRGVMRPAGRELSVAGQWKPGGQLSAGAEPPEQNRPALHLRQEEEAEVLPAAQCRPGSHLHWPQSSAEAVL